MLGITQNGMKMEFPKQSEYLLDSDLSLLKLPTEGWMIDMGDKRRSFHPWKEGVFIEEGMLDVPFFQKTFLRSASHPLCCN